MNAADVLRYGQLTFLGAVERVAADDRDRPGACGSWSVRDLVAHIGSYEVVLVDVLRSLDGATDTPALDRIIELRDGFNDAEVEARRGESLEALLTELNEAHEETLRLVGDIGPARLREPGTMPWYGAEYAVDDLIVYQYYGHKREHGAQIEMFQDHLRPLLEAGADREGARR